MAEQARGEELSTRSHRNDCGCGCCGDTSGAVKSGCGCGCCGEARGAAKSDCGCGCGGGLCGGTTQKVVWV